MESDVIPRTSALAAQEHGDARKAIDILRHAGEIAQAEGANTVHDGFVDQARSRAETDRFRELIEGLTPHSRLVLQSLTLLTINAREQSDINSSTGFRTSKIYDLYRRVCKQEGKDPLSLRRVRDLLKEHAFLDITKQARHSGGSAEGSYTEHTLLEDPDVIKEVLSDTSE